VENLNTKRYSNPKIITQNEIKNTFNYCLSQIDESLDKFTYKYPAAASVNLIYPTIDNDGDWVQGFWTGMLWLAYEVTGNEKYRKVAEIQVEDYLKRIENLIGVNHHDMGFLYSLSCVSAYKLTGNEKAKKAAILAADNLISRFQEKGQFIQAWGELGAKDNYRLIIDCLLNLPLLYWASEVTGDEKYADIAKKHFKTAVDVVIRDDYSTHHTYYFDVETGKPSYGITAQGYSNESAWARGQAWGIYGLPLSYKYIKDKDVLDKYINITNYFLNRLPNDFIPCWDLVFTDDNTQRDSSSASIAVCGMLEMMKYTDENKEYYQNAINNIMSSLMQNYSTKGLNSNGILTHAVYSIPHGGGIDECNIWGDYYYMEALVRLIKDDWVMYW
jgi:unsaturated chondroitin disaccharide hydrolase